MSAACCVRPRCSEARAKRAKGEISAADLKAIEDREIERVIKKQEEVGLQAVTDGEFRRSWWHLDFLWGLDGVERHVMDERRRVRGGEDARRRHQGHRQGRLHRPSDDRALQVRRRSHQGHAEDHHSGAVRDLRPPDADADRQDGLSGPRRVLPRSSGRPTARPCARSRTPAAAISSSTRCSSRCCATRSTASRCATAATIPRSSARSTAT